MKRVELWSVFDHPADHPHCCAVRKILVEDDGSLKTKAQFLESVKLSNGNQEQVAPESLTVRVFGKTAIAIGVIAVKATKGGKSVVHRERFIDTWINKNGSWVCIATDATPITHGGS